MNLIQNRNIFFLTCFLAVCFSDLKGQEMIHLRSKIDFYSIEPNVAYIEDKERNLGFEQIITPAFQPVFKLSPSKRLNFGYSDAAYWLKFQVYNQTIEQKEWYLEFDYPLLDSIVFHYQDEKQQWQKRYYGDRFPFNQRDIAYRSVVIALPLEFNKVHTFYLYISTQSSSQIKLSLRSNENFASEKLNEQMVYGHFFGILVAMLFYNLLIFFSLRDYNYLFYVITIFFNLLLFTSLNGYFFQYVLPDSPYWANMLVLIALNGVSFWITFFTREFLEVKKYAPFFHSLQNIFLFLVSTLFILPFFIPYLLAGKISIVMAFVAILLVLATSFKCWAKGNKASRVFVMAWLFYLLGSILVILRNVGLLPVAFITSHSIEIGNSLQVILLSLALADKYRLFKKDKERIQQENLKIQREANEQLERKVIERTDELKKANEILNSLNEELNANMEQVQVQKREIQKKNEDILSSINYAQRIQKAMMRRVSQEHLVGIKDYFVLLRPRDVVSGDFYFFQKFHSRIIVAAADCTGHGVPGALMSMIGNNLLNQIIQERQITQPNLILFKLHQDIQNTLQQRDTLNQDGMDIAICTIDLETQHLSFSGAKNKLIYFQNGQINQIAGDKYAIGGGHYEGKRIFTQHDISLAQPTTFYLFSDGYCDQFGGENNSKFLISRFRNLLAEIHALPMAEQKNILDKTLQSWMQNIPQTDDILVIGISL